MPSRQPPPQNHHENHLLAPLIAAAISVSILAAIAYLYRKLTLSLSRRTAPAPLSTPDRPTSPPPPPKELRRFKYSRLKKATGGFGELSRIGQGGFGSVYRAVFPREAGGVFAVKVMDAAAGSIQGEREFHNEISLATRVISATAAFGYPHLVSVVGYSTIERHHERKLIVYEYMSNGSLQEKLLDSKCPELCIWEKRLKIIIHVAKALQFLHFDCGNTSVVHGDVKPSNVLLDDCFNAKLGDFGLARILDDIEDAKLDEIKVLHPNDVNLCNHDEIEEVSGYNAGSNNVNNDVGSIVEEESVSVITAEPSPVVGEVAVSPSEGFDRESSLADSWGDKMSLESGKKKGSGRDYWWWKQGDDSSSGRVKDYVMEWIGSEIKKERSKSSDLLAATSSINCNDGKIELKKKNKKRLQRWWSGPLNDEDKLRKKGRKPREWWKEEFCEELSKKSKKSKSKLMSKSSIGSEKWWQRDEEFEAPETKKRRKRNISFGSIDWWLDGLSGELRNGGIGRRNSQDWAASGCDIPKSGGISSTPSMRGTMCYIAPEYGGGGQLSEKCDVYSFGVLVLVVISGRRPLQVLASPMSEFERANLVSWARQLAYNGKLLDLVDSSIQSLDKEQAMLCITIALQCLQRSPSKRPNMKEILQMLMGETEPPHLPFEFSPSPPSNFPFKSRKKGR